MLEHAGTGQSVQNHNIPLRNNCECMLVSSDRSLIPVLGQSAHFCLSREGEKFCIVQVSLILWQGCISRSGQETHISADWV